MDSFNSRSESYALLKPYKLTLEDPNGNKAFITIRAKDVDEAIRKVKVEYNPECTLKVSETTLCNKKN